MSQSDEKLAESLVLALVSHHLETAKGQRDSIPFQSYSSVINECESIAAEHEYEAAFVIETAIALGMRIDVSSLLEKHGYGRDGLDEQRDEVLDNLKKK